MKSLNMGDRAQDYVKPSGRGLEYGRSGVPMDAQGESGAG